MQREDLDMVLDRLCEAQGLLSAWLDPENERPDKAALARLLLVLDDRELLRAQRALRRAN